MNWLKTDSIGNKYELLNEVDWDFKNKSNKKDIHSIHPYPAKFIPEIPRTLISILGVPEGSVVVDPFCGSGTTLVEAQNAGFNSIGIDLNPIACLISTAKTKPLPDSFLQDAETVIRKSKEFDKNIKIKEIKNLDHWFMKDIQVAIQLLINNINTIKSEHSRNFLRMCLSSIIVRVSNQDSDTRYAAVEKNIKFDDVFIYFLKACKRLKEIKDNDLRCCDYDSTILNKNILNVKEADIKHKIGLIITSPPYPNAYEYWLYHKYRMWWLDYDAENVKKQEIGARPHYFKKKPQTPDDFKKQMIEAFGILDKKLVKGAHICIVIGRSIIRGEVVDNARMIEEVGETLGWNVVLNTCRKIKQSRKSFNLSHAKIKKENLLVFRKD